jgi:thymidylate synthase ThyX
MDHFRRLVPKAAGDSDFVYRQAVRAKAFDAVRGVLPVGSLSNVGIYGSGQAYESLLLRMAGHPLPEARDYATLMLGELRKVIPSFLRRVDQPERGGAWAAYLSATAERMEDVAEHLFGDEPGPGPGAEEPTVRLVDFDPDGERKMLVAMLYPYVNLSEARIAERVERLSAEERVALVRAYAGERTNRRHKPGRALERTDYRFEVLADYGAFRDLQRHRMLTVVWQPVTPLHGYVRPTSLDEAGVADRFDEAMSRSAALYDELADELPAQAAYAVCLAYRVRFTLQMNAREAMHLVELRSQPQGHPSYRRIAQDMHRLISEEAGHHAVAEMMCFVDHSGEADLERLQGERRSEHRRRASASAAPG